MVVAVCIGIIIGMFIGRFFREFDNDCPSVELGYDCKGSRCDHRKSELYRAKMNMALHRERYKPDHNYWRGDDK